LTCLLFKERSGVMSNRFLFLNWLVFGIVHVPLGRLYAQAEEGEMVVISERVGKEIDMKERDHFELFPEVKGFQSAFLVKWPENRYILKITYLDERTGEPRFLDSPQSEASINNMRRHIDHFEELPAHAHQHVSTSSMDPLAERKVGLEFSPIRLLLGWTDKGTGRATHLSGAVSLFAIDRHAEVAFPILVVLGNTNNIPFRILFVDATYRRFLGDRQGGFYLSGGGRYACASGEELLSYDFHTGNKVVRGKFGFYAGIGYRYFHKSGFYWGTNIIVGRYLDGNNPSRVGDPDVDDGTFLIDSELIKIGYAF
jgi:hypothetical protein